MSRKSCALPVLCGCLVIAISAPLAWADGKLVAPRDYKGSLEEKAQEAILIFHSAAEAGEATEDLILKIQIAGNPKRFAWVIPFPGQPKIAKEDPRLFKELFDYVETRLRSMHKGKGEKLGAAEAKPQAVPGVEVLSRKIVGSYDTAVIREKVAGALNTWLKEEGFQTLDDAEDVIGFYREKGYVFACVKVSAEQIEKDKPVESHPLRFSFKTGGRDGIFYPMKMTGLQTAPFSVNLYIFYGAWINDRLSRYGYVHRGFLLHYRDWDTRECKPNAGKTWSSPGDDPFLQGMASRLPTATKLFQKLHPGERYYLTNIQAYGLKPADVREWADDLWVFPYYVDREFTPYDARPGAPASAAWHHQANAEPVQTDPTAAAHAEEPVPARSICGILGVASPVMMLGSVLGLRLRQRRKAGRNGQP